MKKGRFTESQIVTVLKEGESGIPVTEICRKYGIANGTYYTWKSRYSGMTTSDLKKLKDLENENSKLKQMYADISLEHRILKDIVEKKL